MRATFVKAIWEKLTGEPFWYIPPPSEIELKVVIEKKMMYLKILFLSLRSLSQDQFWGASNHTDINEFLNYLLQVKNQRS